MREICDLYYIHKSISSQGSRLLDPLRHIHPSSSLLPKLLSMISRFVLSMLYVVNHVKYFFDIS